MARFSKSEIIEGMVKTFQEKGINLTYQGSSMMSDDGEALHFSFDLNQQKCVVFHVFYVIPIFSISIDIGSHGYFSYAPGSFEKIKKEYGFSSPMPFVSEKSETVFSSLTYYSSFSDIYQGYLNFMKFLTYKGAGYNHDYILDLMRTFTLKDSGMIPGNEYHMGYTKKYDIITSNKQDYCIVNVDFYLSENPSMNRYEISIPIDHSNETAEHPIYFSSSDVIGRHFEQSLDEDIRRLVVQYASYTQDTQSSVI